MQSTSHWRGMLRMGKAEGEAERMGKAEGKVQLWPLHMVWILQVGAWIWATKLPILIVPRRLKQSIHINSSNDI
jgi:hypothetical protein